MKTGEKSREMIKRPKVEREKEIKRMRRQTSERIIVSMLKRKREINKERIIST